MSDVATPHSPAGARGDVFTPDLNNKGMSIGFKQIHIYTVLSGEFISSLNTYCTAMTYLKAFFGRISKRSRTPIMQEDRRRGLSISTAAYSIRGFSVRLFIYFLLDYPDVLLYQVLNFSEIGLELPETPQNFGE